MSDINDEDGHRTKRFKFQSYNEQLKGVHVPASLERSRVDEALEDEDSLFHGALSHWMQLNLSPSFISFAQKVLPLSQSLALLLHSWREVVDLWISYVRSSDDEALKALLDLLQKLAEDLRTTVAPAYEEVINCLFELLPRRLPPEVLSTLLGTLLAMFKLVILPLALKADGYDVISVTWTRLSAVLVKCNNEVQRAVAEAWSSVLRRFKKDDRQRCVNAMMDSSRHLNDFITWSLVFAAKSVAQTIHNCGPCLVELCLDYHLLAPEDGTEDTFRLLRRLLTALLHHCSRAEQFSVISDPLIERLASEKEVGKVRRMLDVLAVPCSVRQGSRLTSKQLSTILDTTVKMEYDATLRKPLLTIITAALGASSSDLSVWLGAGRRAIDHVWSIDKKLAISLTGALHEIGWKGFIQFALPTFLKGCLELLSSSEASTKCGSKVQIQTLRLLSGLVKNNMLKNVDDAWRTRLTEWISNWFERFSVSEDSVTILFEITPLLALLHSHRLLPYMVNIVQRLASTDEDVKIKYSSSWANDAFVLGHLVQTIASNNLVTLLEDFDAVQILCSAIKRWSWSEYVMEGLADLAKSCSHSLSEQPISDREAILEELIRSLKSHSHIVRRSSLELLSMPWIGHDNTFETVKCCRVAELVLLSIQGVRERVLLTSRVAQAPLHDDRAAQICVAWLLGQLKVSLRPLWGPAAQALATLAERSPHVVWSMIFLELTHPEGDLVTANMPVWDADANQVEDEIDEEERSWRDPSAHKLRVALGKWTSNATCRDSIIKILRPRDRFDVRSYESQLLMTVGEFPSLAEKHSRELVPLFLSFASSSSSEKASRLRLVNWLKLFSKFSNPKAFHRTDEVHTVYTLLLSHPDRNLQSVSLSCLQTYKSPALSRKSDILSNLLDDTKWRDEIAMLNLQDLSAEEREELVPVLVRLFYGMMRERGGRGKGADRRSALLGVLAACTEDELALLADLMVEPFEKMVNFDSLGGEDKFWELVDIEGSDVPEKQQIGFLMLLADVLRILGTRVTKSWPRLLSVTITLAASAQQKLQNTVVGIEDVVEDEEDNEGAKVVDSGVRSTTNQRQMRLIRQLGLKRLTEFFKLPSDFLFTPYIPMLYREIISPRIPLLDRENTQSPSSLLELLNVWTTHPDMAMYLVQYDDRTLEKVFDCLVATNVKPAVQIRIFDMLERLLTFSAENASFLDIVLRPYMSGLLNNIALAVQRSTESGSASVIGGIAQRELAILSKLSPYITNGTQAATLLSIFLSQLRKMGRGIPEKSKTDMLDILCNLMPRIAESMDDQTGLFLKTYETISHMFQHLRGRRARLALTDAFNVLASIDQSILSVADVITSLNSYSTTRIDEPDFDRRLAAFATLNEERWKMLGAKEWAPFLHNMLYFIQDEDELSIRTNASLSLKRFVEALANDQEPDMQLCFVRILFPGLKRGLRTKSDLVRAEVMAVLAFAVEKCININALQEMRILLAGGDEEASFFNNIFHIQVHRRTRALRRLADFCDEPGFRSSTLQEIFIPVVNNFIHGSGTIDHHLVNEAITTLGHISKHLAWPAYFALVQQYIKLATEKNAAERTYMRALVSILDNFHFAMEDTFTEEVAPEVEDERAGIPEVKIASATTKIHDAVINRLLPTLLKHLEQRDELEDANRIPLAIGIAKVSLHLPETSRDLQITRLLTVLSQIFRSKSQETRDIARETLCRITVMLGPAYLSVVIRQLREALTRGPHLHVLAYVTHAVLVHVTLPENAASFDTLDDSVPNVVHVSAEVVFGESKKDVESEGFRTKMKEVKGSSSKGLDSFAILAKHMTPAASSNLLLPVKAIMQETESVKMMQVVEELLRRIAVGVNANIHFGPAELLVFCHSLISQNARFFQEEAKLQKRRAKKVNDAIVNLKRKIEPEDDHYIHNSWRFVIFGLDLFNTAYRRGRFDLKDANIIARLEPMVNLIGNTLYSSNGSVISSGLTAAAQIAKAPLKNVEKSLPVFIRQTLQIIRETGSTEADVVQTAFKSLSVIIRDVPSAQIKEKDLTFLLELITPDLEEVTRQANAFAVLRAIISRKFVVPEIYDLMDRVQEIMVTSQSPQVQELCRSVLLQFLLDYPQGKNRLKQQFSFLVKNLSYVFESGRKSVLEFLSAVIIKFNDDIIVEYADMLFVALVLVIANDDSTKCREMAAQLVKMLLERLREDQRKSIVSHVHSWAVQRGNPALARVSSQIYGLVVDTLKTDSKQYINLLLEDINAKIQDTATTLDEVRNSIDDNENVLASEANWQVPYQALTAISKVFQHFPEVISEHDKISWSSISTLLLYPHAWVRTASCRLLGSLFSVTPITQPDRGLADDFPLSPKGMRELGNSFSLQLKSENLDEALALQVVKNLFYVGKCFYAIPIQDTEDTERMDASQEEEDVSEDGEDEEGKSGSEDGAENDKRALDTNDNPLPWLFSRLSYQARSAYIARVNNPNKKNWFRQLQAIFQWFAAMASYMDNGMRLERFLPHILSPVYRVAEDDIIKDPAMDDLKALTTSLLDLLQSRVGVTAFSRVYASIRARVTKVRQERKTARVLRRSIDPRGAAERKMRRNAGKGKRKRDREKEGAFKERKLKAKVSKRMRVD